MSYFTKFLGVSSKENDGELLENLSTYGVLSEDNDLLCGRECIAWSDNRDNVEQTVRISSDARIIQEPEESDEKMNLKSEELRIVKREAFRQENEEALNDTDSPLPDSFFFFHHVTLSCAKDEFGADGNEDVSITDPLAQVTSQKPHKLETLKIEHNIKTEKEEEGPCLFEEAGCGKPKTKDLDHRTNDDVTVKLVGVCDQVKREVKCGDSVVDDLDVAAAINAECEVKDHEMSERSESNDEGRICTRKNKTVIGTCLKEVRVILERVSSSTDVYNLRSKALSTSIAVQGRTRGSVNTLNSKKKEGKEMEKSGKGSFICSHCKAVYVLRREYEDHLGTHLKRGSRRFVCHICRSVYDSNSKLKSHLRHHARPRKFLCHFCQIACKSKPDLAQHIRTHTGEKPFLCSLCSSAFAQLGTLRQHLRTHTGDKPFRCGVCDATFARSGDRNRHVKSHAGAKCFFCHHCSASFLAKGDLRRHISCHMGEKHYVCNQCQRGFNRKQTLVKHIQCHNGKEPYKHKYSAQQLTN